MANEIICSITPQQSYKLGEPITLTFEVKNQSNRDYYLLPWNTPLDNFFTDFITLTSGRKTIPFDGILVKRIVIEGDFLRINAQSSIIKQIDISTSYSIDSIGEYQVSLNSRILDLIDVQSVIKKADLTKRSDSEIKGYDFPKTIVKFSVISGKEPKLTIGEEHRRSEAAEKTTEPNIDDEAKGEKSARGPIIHGGTNSQRNEVLAAHNKAFHVICKSANDLNGRPSGSKYYKEWFGNYDSSRFNKVKKNYEKMHDVLLERRIRYRINGLLCRPNVYAYTIQGGRTIWLCDQFWATTSGADSDSQFGTIIHELSHAVCFTLDKCYGMENSRNLAATKPQIALKNADNYQYFSESLALKFGNIKGLNSFVDKFTGDGTDDILIYFPTHGNWQLGKLINNQISWSLAGNTSGFGDLSDGRPFWVGNFSADNTSDILFYYPGDGNWWLGKLVNNLIQWNLSGNTLGQEGGPNFGQVMDGRPFWVGKFSGDSTTDILFYSPGDGNWWLGKFVNNQIQWNLASNTLGQQGGPNFGQVMDGRPFWVGNFSNDNTTDILFYHPGDGNWWLGKLVNNQVQWNFASNTLGKQGGPNFGQVWDGRPFWTGNFSGDNTMDILFYYPGDGNWWLGKLVNNQIQWNFASNTLGKQGGPNFGQVWDGRPFWTGNFSGDNTTDILFHCPDDGNWWLGKLVNNQIQWNFAGNTLGQQGGPNFGQVWDGRPFWVGNFSGDNTSDILFYYPGDDNWWLGRFINNQLQWNLASNTTDQLVQ